MEATKLLLFLAFHVGAADSSGDEISNQETQLFFDRALKTAVVGHDLDPLEFPGFEYEVSVATAKVKLYNITVHGLGTVCSAGENFISADNNGTCLKIDVAVRNVTVSVRANVTVSLFLFTSTVMMETIVLVNFTEVTLDIQEKNVELKVEELEISGTDAVDIKTSEIGEGSFTFAAAKIAFEAYVKTFFSTGLKEKFRDAITAKLDWLYKFVMSD
uniref:Putative secreted protein n=1 Tax=Ixodes ricinus TaxID=34613 RepID=A0A0K8R7U0_IXORI